MLFGEDALISTFAYRDSPVHKAIGYLMKHNLLKMMKPEGFKFIIQTPYGIKNESCYSRQCENKFKEAEFFPSMVIHNGRLS